MLQLTNSSPLGADFYVLPNRDGVDTLYVAAKARFQLAPRVELSAEPAAPLKKDVFWGDSQTSSLRYPSEVHLEKPGTDVLLLGRALAPARQTHAMTVTMLVGRASKSVYVFGDRFWMPSGEPSSPSEFETTPLLFERAYGGTQTMEDGTVRGYDANPVGVGFTGGRPAHEMVGQPVPNLERPDQRVVDVTRVVEPAGFGAVAPHWPSRRVHAGTYDEEWQRTRAPFLPLDFDARFMQTALPDQTFSPHLVGGEPISITGVAPHGQLDFVVPRIELDLTVLTRRERVRLETKLESIWIEPDENALSLTYRASYPCPGSPLDIRQIQVALVRVGP